MTIRNVSLADAPALAAIYRPYVEQTMVSAELIAPDADEMARRIQDVWDSPVFDHVGLPYLVAEEDGQVVAYCYAHKFHPRRAIDQSVELSIYVRHDYHSQGLGRALYTEMEEQLRALGVTNSYVSISYTAEENEHLTHASILFHRRMGYTQCACFHHCAVKFGIPFDVVWMEKFL